MADVKVDKSKYLKFLARINEFLDDLDDDLKTDLQEEKKLLKDYIDREQDIVILSETRKNLFDFYAANKHDPVSSQEVYKKYLETKEKLNTLRDLNDNI